MKGSILHAQTNKHCTAELFMSIFHSFKAGIANAISSFKWIIYIAYCYFYAFSQIRFFA